MRAVDKNMDPAEVVRCTGCGRLVEKVNARPGPAGGTYGPGCYRKAVAASRDDPYARPNEDA